MHVTDAPAFLVVLLANPGVLITAPFNTRRTNSFAIAVTLVDVVALSN